MRGTLLIGTLLLIATIASAAPSHNNPEASTPTTLYLHLLDGRQDFPVNTQMPSDDFQVSGGTGLADHSTSCLAPQDGLVGRSIHTWYGYSSPSLVEYDRLQDGMPVVHPERGLSYDVILDGSFPSTYYFYLETQAGPPQTSGQVVPLPNVVVKTTIRTGTAIGIGDENYNQGEILATGTSAAARLAGDATEGATYLGGSPPRYEFAIPLDVLTDRIPSTTGYNVRTDVYIDDPAGLCSDPSEGSVMPNAVRIHSSPGLRPRFDVATLNPVAINVLHPMIVGDDIVVHAAMNSPWGSYDVDEQGGVELSIAGPSVPQKVDEVLTHHISIHGPDAHFQPLTGAYIWPYRSEGAQPGLYTFTLTAWNDQHTAMAESVSTFELGKGPGDSETCFIDETGQQVCDGDTKPTPTGSNGSPGAALPAVLAGLAAVVFAIRRKQS